MSRDIIILTPNGRRVKIHCTADTNFLQVLEDVCNKQGFQSEEYDLKHHNKVLDLTTTIRFCNLPNKAMLEMVETDKKRVETNVVIGLHLEDGERKTGDFPSKTTLFDLVSSLAPNELTTLKNPTIMYMRQEVVGISALKEKTLRQLGLLTGRAILRLLDKADEAVQANVSAVYRRQTEKLPNEPIAGPSNKHTDHTTPGPSNARNSDLKKFDPIKLIKKEVKVTDVREENENLTENKEHIGLIGNNMQMDIDSNLNEKTEPCTDIATDRNNIIPYKNQENLERRLKIEEEVTFLGTQKAVAFMQPDTAVEDVCDLPDDFYELTVEEVRRIYHDLQQQRIELENTPLLTANKREELNKQTLEQKINMYNHAVVRIQFPDNIILQGVFEPTNTIEDICKFVKEHLQHPEKPFKIFTTPLKEELDPQTTLLAAKFVPCVHMHFKWLDEDTNQQYLREDIYTKKTSSDAASILASKYRAPSRKKMDEVCSKSQDPKSGTTKQSKVPKWFK